MAGLFQFEFLLLFYLVVLNVSAGETSENAMFDEHVTSDFVFWPNATIPFYIDPEHYDHEQSLSIMRTLSLYSFKTCLKFAPVLARPRDSEHVMLFENPKGIRMCSLNSDGHSMDEPHKIVLGYDCLRSPDVDMMITNALGLPFEHNRAFRDLYIDVLQENIEPGYIELFTIETKLPVELRALPYDVNSALHFGQRAFSKNGHKTIIFKDHTTKQNRVGLSDLDLRKIQIIYGPECLNRDRQEKVELCQNYPGVARRKRQVDDEPTKSIDMDRKSLRVNPDITPPPSPELSQDLQDNLKDLGVEDKIQEIVDQVNKVSALALRHAREKYCNNTKGDLRTDEDVKRKTDILGIVESVAEYTKIMVEHAVQNLTEFCEESRSIEVYERARCPFYDQNRCIKTNYRSTKSGPPMYSTQHRPLIRQSTKHVPNRAKVQYDNPFFMRATEDTNTTDVVRRRRHTDKVTKAVTETTVIEFNRRVESSNNSEPAREVRSDERNASSADGAEVSRKDKEQIKSEAKKSRKTDTDAKKIEQNMDYAQLDRESENGDLRVGKTSRPILKKADYAPSDRRNFDGFSFSYIFKSKKPNAVRSNSWDDNRASLEQNNNLRSTGDRYRQRNKDNKIKEEKYSSIESQVENGWGTDKVNRETDDDSNSESVGREKEESDIDTEERVRDRGRINKVIRDIVEREGNKKRKTSSGGRNIEQSDTDTEKFNRDRARFKKVTRDSDELEKNKKRRKPNRYQKVNTKYTKQKQIDSDDDDMDYNDNEDKSDKIDELSNENAKPKRPKKEDSESSREDDRAVNFPPDHTEPRKKFIPETVPLSKINREFYNERRWPRGVVPYMITEDGTFDVNDVRVRLGEVNKILRAKTCVRLEEIREREANKYEDYLVLDSSPDYVTGRVGGRQPFGVVELLRGGQHRQHAAMVVMAMLGFYFEVARHDRDIHIKVHTRHVRPDKLHHFEKIRDDATLNLPYDYKSATHPAWQFWRQLGKTGISTVATYKEQDPDGSLMRSLGQNRQLLSNLDLVKINSIYGVRCFHTRRSYQPEEY